MRNKCTNFIFVVILMLSFAMKAEATVYYVKSGATGNGSDWSNASGDLQAMINLAQSGDQIWIAAGTYKPNSLPGATGNTETRDVAFVLKSGVKIYGGFAGTETALDQRSIATNITILSGDIGTVNNKTDNAYHVVVSINNTEETVLDGVQVTEGNANGSGFYVIEGQRIFRNTGGALFTRGSKATFSNITFSENEAGRTGAAGNGGALYILTSSIVIEDAVFSKNKIFGDTTAGGAGGAAFLIGTADTINKTTFNRVRFSENSSDNSGGAIFTQHFTNPVFNEVSFTDNIAGGAGGGLYATGNTASPNNIVFTKTKLEGNKSLGGSGGAITFHHFTKATLDDVEFNKNTAAYLAGALYIIGNTANPNTITVKKSLFKENISGTSGGAFYVNVFSDVNFEETEFTENTAGSTGGAFFAVGDATRNNEFIIVNSSFNKNKASAAGGAGYISSYNTARIDRTRFMENQSTTSIGGALFTFSLQVPTSNENIFITNSLFYGNQITNANTGGGAIFVSNYTKPTIINSTFYGNKSVSSGAAISINNHTSANLNVYNSIFNENNSNGTASDIFKGSNSILTLKNSLTQITGVNGVDGVLVGADPGFISTTPGTENFLYLNTGSVAIDKGDNTLLPSTYTKDISGNDRFFNVTVDMGAHEYNSADIPTTPQTITFENDFTADYGDQEIDPAATASSNLPIVYTSNNTQVAIIVNNKIQIVGAGTAEITASQPGNQTYIAANPVIRTITVSKVPLTIKAADLTVEQYLPFPNFSVNYNGFVNGDNASNLTTAPTVTTTASSSSAPGEYDLIVGGAVSDNYEISYEQGTLTITTGVAGNIYYVKPDGTGNGNSWASASGDLQATITAASEGDQIWVAAGTYKPTSLPGATGTLGARDVSFVLKNGVKIFGGFNGTETIISDRNITTNKTILSGDLGIANDSADNAYHVVLSINNTDNTILDGFTITGGTANQDGVVVVDGQTIVRTSGGGIFARGSKAAFNNIIVSGNISASTEATAGFGGGIYSYASTIVLQDVQLTNNRIHSANTLGGVGGAIYIGGNSDTLSSVTIRKGTLTNNSSRNAGGAINMGINASLSMDDFTIADNLATNSSGGGIFSRSETGNWNTILLNNGNISSNQTLTGSGGAMMLSYYTNATITNTLITDNKCISSGGGIYIQGNTDNVNHNVLVLTNVEFYKNIASGTGSGTGGGGYFQNNYHATLNNVIFRENYGNVATGALQLAGRVNTKNNFKMTGGGFYKNNTPVSTGAVVLGSNVNYEIDRVEFIENTAGTVAGAMWISGTGTAGGENATGRVSNSLFYNNEAKGDKGGGGAIYITATYSSPLIVNNTFYKNRAVKDGGALLIADNANTNVRIANSIIDDNTAITGTGADIFKGANAAVNLTNSMTQVFGTNGTNGNIVGSNPSFSSVDPAHSSFLTLDASSPAINTGNNTLLPAEITTDLKGNARVVNGTVDMGAYEFVSGQTNPTIVQTITFESDMVKTYGNADFNAGAVSSSGLQIVYTSSNTAVATVVGSNIRITGAGTATITAAQPGNGTYLPAESVTRTLTVSKAPLIAKANDITIEQLKSFPAFTITYTGFVNGETESSLTTRPVVTTSAISNSVTGDYKLSVSGGESNKYEITYQEGILTITPAFVNDNKLEAWFRNSSTLLVNVEVPSDQTAVLALFSSTGQRIYTADVTLRKGKNHFTIPAERMLPGVYIINVKGGSVQLDNKFIKR